MRAYMVFNAILFYLGMFYNEKLRLLTSAREIFAWPALSCVALPAPANGRAPSLLLPGPLDRIEIYHFSSRFLFQHKLLTAIVCMKRCSLL